MKAVLKMFFVMGLTWITDVLTWALSWTFGAQNVQTVRALKASKYPFRSILNLTS